MPVPAIDGYTMILWLVVVHCDGADVSSTELVVRISVLVTCVERCTDTRRFFSNTGDMAACTALGS